MASVAFGSLPFAEQIAFFRAKLDLPTETWTDILHEMHDRAFVVAGANRLDLVADFRDAVVRDIANGETLAQFRKRFDMIVEKYGWDYVGGRNWRSRVIYETNLRQSYNAGRYAQLQALKKMRPYWRYRHADGEKYPRPLHQAWNGLVLSADDPWWDTHFPANGWGCKCYVEALNERDLKRLGKDGPDEAPPLDMQTVTIGQRGPTPRTIEVPAGVDPGFGYAPGKDAWFRRQAEAAAENGAQARVNWETTDPRGPADFQRPPHIPMTKPPVPLGPRIENTSDAVLALRDVLGGYHRVFDVHGLPIAMDAATLGSHITDWGRTPFFPLLADLLADPFEVWLVPQRNPETGSTRLIARIIKGYRIGRNKTLLLVANYRDGQLLGWTFIPSSDVGYINRQRQGALWWGATDE